MTSSQAICRIFQWLLTNPRRHWHLATTRAGIRPRYVLELSLEAGFRQVVLATHCAVSHCLQPQHNIMLARLRRRMKSGCGLCYLRTGVLHGNRCANRKVMNLEGCARRCHVRNGGKWMMTQKSKMTCFEDLCVELTPTGACPHSMELQFTPGATNI